MPATSVILEDNKATGLSADEETALKHRSIVELYSQQASSLSNASLAYADLMQRVHATSIRELEDLLIDAFDKGATAGFLFCLIYVSILFTCRYLERKIGSEERVRSHYSRLFLVVSSDPRGIDRFACLFYQLVCDNFVIFY